MPKLNTQTEQTKTSGDLRDSNTAAMLYSFVERLERLDEEREGLAADTKEVRAEAKGLGFDTKILGVVLRRRKMDSATREESDDLVDLYERTIQEQAKKQIQQSEDEAGD